MSKERDILYGRHSLIPECCIAFFVGPWNRYRMCEGSGYSQAINDSEKYNYVPCPACFYSGKVAKIKMCDDECGGRKCWMDF